jgi:hypothetical protein
MECSEASAGKSFKAWHNEASYSGYSGASPSKSLRSSVVILSEGS